MNTNSTEGKNLPTITLTEQAAKKYLQILKDEGKLGWGLRLGGSAGGCSGTNYFLDFSEKPQPDDMIFESHGIQIHILQSSLELLKGTVIDYVEGASHSGFKISNPHARKSCCGCNNSGCC